MATHSPEVAMSAKHAAFTMLHGPHDFTIPPEPGGGETHAARYSAEQARTVETLLTFFRSIGTGPRSWSEIQRLAVALLCRQLLEDGYLDRADPKQIALIRARVIEHEARMRLLHEQRILDTWRGIVSDLEERITQLVQRGRIHQAGRHLVAAFKSLAEFKVA